MMDITINRVAEGDSIEPTGYHGNEPLILKIHKERSLPVRRNPENEMKRDYEEY